MRKKVNLSSKIWKNEIRLIAVQKQNVQLVQTSYINELNCSCFCHIINILLTELSRSVWENLDLGRVYRPLCVRSVLTTSVKILPYRPHARLIRAKYKFTVVYCESVKLIGYITVMCTHCILPWFHYANLDIRRNILQNLQTPCMEPPCWCASVVHQHGGWKIAPMELTLAI